MSSQDPLGRGGLSWLMDHEPVALELLVGQERSLIEAARSGALWVFGAWALMLTAGLIVGSSLPQFHWLALTGITVMGLLTAPVAYALAPRLTYKLQFGLIAASIVQFMVAVGLAGPRFGEAAAIIVAGQSTLWIYWRPRVTAMFLVVAAIAYAFILGSQPGYPRPAARWAFLIGLAVLMNTLLYWVSSRVRSQYRQIQRLNRLRRFLAPQVAEVVLRAEESGEESLLTPHRGQIAVVFCDLRGFTSFANGAEPEEVVDVLHGYYAVVGQLLQEFEATVGSFAGDGIMAYFNDPVPCDDPAGKAVRMAVALREPMASLTAIWASRGFDLGYGVGIAYGFATLGTIGFQLRSDYTAVGSVVNLAARLCAEAKPGEILIDSRTQQAVHAAVESRELSLKGFPSTVQAFVMPAAAS